jgi:Flp pilus assembly protein TadB
MSELFGHWPSGYHAPDHPPEDQGWGWLIVLVVGALAVAAGVLIDWPAALGVIVVAALLLLLSRVRRRVGAKRMKTQP